MPHRQPAPPESDRAIRLSAIRRWAWNGADGKAMILITLALLSETLGRMFGGEVLIGLAPGRAVERSRACMRMSHDTERGPCR